MKALKLRQLLAPLGRPDVLRDVHIYGGLGLVAWGGWYISPRWTAVALGGILAAFGILGPLLGRQGNK